MQRQALWRPGGLLVVAIVLLSVAGTLFAKLSDLAPVDAGTPLGLRAPSILFGCLVAWMVALAALTRTVHVVAPALGSIGVVLAFCLLLAYTGSSVIATVDRWAPKPQLLFATTGLRRIPVLSLLLVWFLLASQFSFGERLHDVLPGADDRTKPQQGIGLAGVFTDWVTRHCLLGDADPKRRELPAVPLVFVASSGGGIRAAVWTSMVLETAFGSASADQSSKPTKGTNASCSNTPERPTQLADRASWVIAASGVSGGSLGIATWAAKLTESRSPGSSPPADEAASTQTDWIEARLGKDYVAPSLAWMLFMEAPWSLLGFNADRDRAAVLEESWERSWPDEPGLDRSQVGSKGLRQGMFGFRAKHPELPVLLFNGTSVESGCRFNASVLASDGRRSDEPSGACVAPKALIQKERGVLAATIDLHDFLCREDLRLSKAVLLSARFPVISPSGHLKQCATGDAAPPETFVVDGGYLENSGAASALELWTSLASQVEKHNADDKATACVVPFLVQIDNGWGEPAAPGPVPAKPQFQVPLAAAGATRNARAASARQAAKLMFDEAFASGGARVFVEATINHRPPPELGSRYANFSLLAHPGAKAPLGWTVSEQSLQDMRKQLGKRSNQDAKTRVDQWFKPLTCRR
jgi:hypothetical protein